MSQFKNKRVAVLGLSVEGYDSCVFFTKQGARVTCCDRRTKRELGNMYPRLSKLGVSFQLGADYLANLESMDILMRTPGMNLYMPELQRLKKAGVTIESNTKLCMKLCKAPVVGITGTKGKGTTATLIYSMLIRSGIRAHLGGNVGTPLLSRIYDIQKDDWVVMELSSFQLEDFEISPHIAVVLKITSEHLANYDRLATNYHTSRKMYVQAKLPIVTYQKSKDIVIANKDDQTAMSFLPASKAKKFTFSRESSSADAYVKDASVYVKWNNKTHTICTYEDIQLRGIHNLENIAAASIAALHAGAKLNDIKKTVQSFKPLKHRIEFVRFLDNVAFYNDSFSTIPDTAIAAIHSFNEPKILILGGSEKKSDYTEMGKEIARSNTKAVILIGHMAMRIKEALLSAGYKGRIIESLRSMKKIVQKAKEVAKPGDVVLLSPACASFDMFDNYKQRGQIFCHEVSLL